MIAESLQRFGAARGIVVDEDGTVLAGNGVLEAAAQAGIEQVRIVPVDGHEIVAIQVSHLTPEQKAQYAIADNRTTELSEWDTGQLQALIDDGVDLSMFWFDEELDALLAENTVATEPLTDPDDVPAVPDEPITKPGDVWLLGRHRVMCGDSTVVTDVDRLMAGQKAVCLWTDPPYGVSYVGKTKDALTIQNDGSDGLAALLHGAFASATTACVDGASFYIAHPPGALCVTFGQAVLDAGWRFHQTLIWVKDSMVLGHSDYHFRHEPLIFGYMPGTGRRGRGVQGWYGDDSQTSIFEIPRPKASPDHPTGKPVALIEAHLQNSSKAGDLVLDLFGGSGSTLIACEQTGRRAALMELDPKYVDVTVTRWEQFTGQTATREAAVS